MSWFWFFLTLQFAILTVTIILARSVRGFRNNYRDLSYRLVLVESKVESLIDTVARKPDHH